MAFNLLDAVKSYLPADVISKAASYLGESENNITRGVAAAVPLSMAGIIQKAEAGGADTIFNFAKQAFNSGILQNFAGSFSHEGGGIPALAPGLLSGIFGDKFGSIANAVSGSLGLKGSTSSALFGSIVPLILGLLGKHAVDNNLSAGSLSSFLSSQKNAVLGSVPAGFDITKLYGSHGPAPHRVPSVSAAVEPPKSNLVYWILLGLFFLCIMWWLMRSCNGEKHDETAVTETVAHEEKHDTTTTATVPVRESLKLILPNGVEIDAYKGGIEDELVAFIKDSTKMAGKENWFDFTELNFKFATAEIVPESRKEVDNIVQILKAFPKVKIKVGGYTDKVGDEAANVKLSYDRANAVTKALQDAGVGAQVVKAEGYGSQYAKYPATAPEEDRIKDRRVAVSVREK
ncbi:OmpA family protein [Pinibacter aurantiacus]|uniref:OmpA family protein n=1 Tax=Pinibacter aurantiacus TaxID=2851599 RepID=A0A9E2S8R6_9BACT|nr:OmpA family protein [Pinibacter aurantiacus]MBV4356774.1 OmpA family protein [Pinibacter aurantiacus]